MCIFLEKMKITNESGLSFEYYYYYYYYYYYCYSKYATRFYRYLWTDWVGSKN
jgi:hypothetical protein